MNAANSLSPVTVRTHILDPMRAELRLTSPPGLELRGRLMGPRCPFAATVEVAYPVRPVPGMESTYQVVIPEPSLWEPQCPFLYEGPIEEWRDGGRLEQLWLRHGLRKLALGQQGVRLNGRPCPLTGVEVDTDAEDDLLRLRQRGNNLLLAPAGKVELWDQASRLGFLMLGRLDATNLEAWRARTPNVSEFGWLMSEDFAHAGAWRTFAKAGEYFGLLFEAMPTKPLPAGVSFLVVAEKWVDELRPLRLPMIVRRTDGEGTELVSTW